MKKGILSGLSFVCGGVAGVSSIWSVLSKKTKEAQKYADKHFVIMQVMNQWLINKQEGKSLVSFFEENGYKSIAIYGMSYLGERLEDELRDSGIKICYAIDKNAENIYADIDVKSLEDDMDDVDAVVVTAVYFFDEVEEELEKIFDCPIISLEDIVQEV
ncbi:hypothetical protein AALA13_02220 [Lachnospiraceae bacterium 50-23]|nr:hypothetical protein [Dorea sp.]GFI36111.1 hypothetical protein IMSAGC015_00270 [Lachnospiraceae bacterium]